MRNWCSRLGGRFRRRDGVAAVEMALVSPIFLLLLVGFFEFGSFLADASAVEKGVRAGTMLAARSPLPLAGASLDRVTNLVKTGTSDGSGSYTVDGWANGDATLGITVRDVVVGGVVVTVVRIEASVPYHSMFQGLLGAVGLPVPTIGAAQEQAYVGA